MGPTFLLAAVFLIYQVDLVSGQFLECSWVNGRDCTSYHHSEICGTDGVSYPNMCFFAKKYCRDHNIHIQHEGPCNGADPNSGYIPVTTVQPARLRITLSSRALKRDKQAPTPDNKLEIPQAYLFCIWYSYKKSDHCIKIPVDNFDCVTFARGAIFNGENAVQDFFCYQLSHVDCGSHHDEICASDHTTYINPCEYEKHRCTHQNLHVLYFGLCMAYHPS